MVLEVEDSAGLDGLPLYVIERSLYVAGVVDPGDVGLLGARLVAIQGVPLELIARRMRRLRGADNGIATLAQLGNFELALARRSFLRGLLPEWSGTDALNVELRMPDDEARTVSFEATPMEFDVTRLASRLTLPDMSRGEVAYRFLSPGSWSDRRHRPRADSVGHRDLSPSRPGDERGTDERSHRRSTKQRGWLGALGGHPHLLPLRQRGPARSVPGDEPRDRAAGGRPLLSGLERSEASGQRARWSRPM